MPKQTKITCDNCDEDLTTTGKMPKFRLALQPQAIPHIGSVIAAIIKHPPISEDHYFCDFECLGEWLTRTKGI